MRNSACFKNTRICYFSYWRKYTWLTIQSIFICGSSGLVTWYGNNTKQHILVVWNTFCGSVSVPLFYFVVSCTSVLCRVLVSVHGLFFQFTIPSLWRIIVLSSVTIMWTKSTYKPVNIVTYLYLHRRVDTAKCDGDNFKMRNSMKFFCYRSKNV